MNWVAIVSAAVLIAWYGWPYLREWASRVFPALKSLLGQDRVEQGKAEDDFHALLEHYQRNHEKEGVKEAIACMKSTCWPALLVITDIQRGGATFETPAEGTT